MLQLISEELIRRPGGSLCPDCPVTRVGVLAHMIPPQAGTCALRSLAVRARAPLPSRWFKEYGLGIVRRGIVLRQRFDSHGRAIAVDAVGAGGLVSLALSGAAGDESSVGGYAINDVLLCAASADGMRSAMEADSETPKDVVRLQSQALERMERLVDARGRMTVVERVAATLLALADTLSPFRKTDAVSADFQQSDLAALVSARQESVCRALCALERRGLIARGGDGIRIVDRHRLEAV